MLQLSTALSLALLAVVNALPPAGNYNIVNRVMSSTGQQLAMTYGGANNPVTLQPFTSSTNTSQIFKLTVYNAITMSITPQANNAQQLGLTDSSSYVVSRAPYGAVFNIASNSSGYIIGEGRVNPDALWYPETAGEGGKIIFQHGQPATGDFRAFWVFIPTV